MFSGLTSLGQIRRGVSSPNTVANVIRRYVDYLVSNAILQVDLRIKAKLIYIENAKRREWNRHRGK